MGSAQLTLLGKFSSFRSPPPLLHPILIPSPLAPLQVLLMQESVRRIIEVEESKMGERTHTQAEDESENFFPCLLHQSKLGLSREFKHMQTHTCVVTGIVWELSYFQIKE